jgi:REP element-mobilizing transposase RayT
MINEVRNVDYPQRKTVRLKNFDYSSNGAYFITICTQDKANLFGEIVGADSISARVSNDSIPTNNVMMLNAPGQMIDEIYNETIAEFSMITENHYVIMPNHFHSIIIISRADIESAPTMSTFVQSFKRNTTIKYINGVKTGLYNPFNKRIWQRGFYDHIIRNEREYLKILQYIDENPEKWSNDRFYRL